MSLRNAINRASSEHTPRIQEVINKKGNKYVLKDRNPH